MCYYRSDEVNEFNKMTTDCLFCRIAKRDSDAHVIHEDAALMAFLVLCPIRPGHTLIIPKQHFNYFDDVPAELITAIILLGQRLASVMKAHYRIPRVAFLFTGGDLPHAHAHVVPLHEKEDITSSQYIAEQQLTFREAARMPDTELAAIAHQFGCALASRKC
jgi:histidine triad (HIT) family protein